MTRIPPARGAAPSGRTLQNLIASRFLWLGLATVMVLVTGCRQDMHDEPKFFPQRGTSFFPDHRSVRPQVADTVARGQLNEESYFYTGVVNGNVEQDLMPFPATMQVLERGQERFNIYCTPCHSRVGNGAGMIVDRGYKHAANFHDAQRMSQPLSHYFYVMTNGYGAMPDYAAQIAPADRWAIAAYIRALQLSQDASAADVPAGVRVENLKDIAQREGYPESFAEPWVLPSETDVMAQQPDTSQRDPGMAPAEVSTTPIQGPPMIVQEHLENGVSEKPTKPKTHAPHGVK